MYLTAIFMGLAGGLHCAGMCGPLVLAATAKNPFVGVKIVYNLGRVLTYGLLGLLVAGIGGLIQVTVYQNWISYLLGGMLLLIGFGAINGFDIPGLSPLIQRFTGWLKRTFGSMLHGKKNIFFLGMLNGLLPCGLTYLALTYCLTLDHYTDGFLFMIVFGLGTIPVMVGLLWFLGITLSKVNVSYKKVSMVVMIVMGSFLIGRAYFSHVHPIGKHPHAQLITDDVLCR